MRPAADLCSNGNTAWTTRTEDVHAAPRKIDGGVAAQAAATTRYDGGPIRHVFNYFVCHRGVFLIGCPGYAR